MKLQELLDFKQAQLDKLLSELKKAQTLYDSGERDYDKYNKDVLVRTLLTSENIDQFTLLDIKYAIEEFEDRIADSNLILMKGTVPTLAAEAYNDDEYDYVDSIRIELHGFKLRTKEDMEQQAKTITRAWVADALKPPSYKSYVRPVDCKLLDLFKSETIDWETLQKLVYSDCDL